MVEYLKRKGVFLKNNGFSASFYEALDTCLLGRKLTVERSLTGTNDVLRGAPEQGTVLAAEEQTAGRGRGEHIFESPVGGLYFSAILPGEAAGYATIAAAVAVAEAIEEQCGVRGNIKWVNDIQIEGKKLCGILAERRADGGVVLGVGVNTNSRAEQFSPGLRPKITTLADMGLAIDNGRLCAFILNRLETMARANTAALIDMYKERCITIGREIDAPFKARAIGIDEIGRLIVERPDGTRQAISSGEISEA